MARRKSRKQKSPKTRMAVLVVGAPRSGTSAISHMLSKLGVYFGEEADFVDPEIHTHNPIFFELKALNELNEQIFAELGYVYGDFDFIHTSGEKSLHCSNELTSGAIDLIREQLGNRGLIGLKDPRFCFTLPFWQKVLRESGYEVKYVVAHRSPEAVIRSNELVNRFPTAYNRRLTWLSVSALAQHLFQEGAVVQVEYDELLTSAPKVAERLARWLEIRDVDPQVAASVINLELRAQTAAVGSNSGDIDLCKHAREYQDFRKRLDDLGLLALLDHRRSQIMELGATIREQAARLHQLGEALEQSELQAVEQLKRADRAEDEWRRTAELLREVEQREQEAALRLHRLGEALEQSELQAVEQLKRADRAEDEWRRTAELLREVEQREQEAALRLHRLGEALEQSELQAVKQLKRADRADSKIRELESELAQLRAHVEQERFQRDELVEHCARLQRRVSGLERRQQWAIIISGAVLVLVTVALFFL